MFKNFLSHFKRYKIKVYKDRKDTDWGKVRKFPQWWFLW